MGKLYLCPSMMCADFSKLEFVMKDLNDAGVDIYHMDLMDGSFVPNFSLGFEDIKAVRKLTDKPMDIHMMVNDPGRYIKQIYDMGINIVYIHPESDIHPARTLDSIKALGMKAGIAVNPGTSFETVSQLLYIADSVLVMTVNPGYSGQKYLDYVDIKIEQFIKNKEYFAYEVFIDGALWPGKIINLYDKGADGFILGTSALFKGDKDYKEAIAYIKRNAKRLRFSNMKK
ncbi:ribulose-phosphate 3-epimerase [Anaeropeptidivorans aminofermentans]|jgi:ribulose-phosphate 3-epimerase|uniref:ribulose-phosphate 3-epimerase n=1 Tax=Anaeropeptidivorans aminofermentans TaxID=2934315 RepID=UPI0020241F04|nr:ribulose-phosphate 3-epimerase [Anaeropeptidivorans aminofermentans]MBE6012450.1 ribulose-phosphate 3-epimerase [Lachnospiraceae bacterium]